MNVERPQHNPHQLRCPRCRCRFFRNQSGLTKHIRSCHFGQPEVLPRHPLSNALPIHRSDDSSSQGSTPRHPSTPSAITVSRVSPSLSLDQTTFDNNAGSFIQPPHQDGFISPVYSVQGSLRESSPVTTPESNEPTQISKVFHPIINGLYTSLLSPSFFY